MQVVHSCPTLDPSKSISHGYALSKSQYSNVKIHWNFSDNKSAQDAVKVSGADAYSILSIVTVLFSTHKNQNIFVLFRVDRGVTDHQQPKKICHKTNRCENSKWTVQKFHICPRTLNRRADAKRFWSISAYNSNLAFRFPASVSGWEICYTHSYKYIEKISSAVIPVIWPCFLTYTLGGRREEFTRYKLGPKLKHLFKF